MLKFAYSALLCAIAALFAVPALADGSPPTGSAEYEHYANMPISVDALCYEPGVNPAVPARYVGKATADTGAGRQSGPIAQHAADPSRYHPSASPPVETATCSDCHERADALRMSVDTDLGDIAAAAVDLCAAANDAADWRSRTSSGPGEPCPARTVGDSGNRLAWNPVFEARCSA